MLDDFDYLYWKECVAQYSHIFTSEGQFKNELQANREDWRDSGVILEQGCGEVRKRVLVSPSRYVEFLKRKTRRRAA